MKAVAAVAVVSFALGAGTVVALRGGDSGDGGYAGDGADGGDARDPGGDGGDARESGGGGARDDGAARGAASSAATGAATDPAVSRRRTRRGAADAGAPGVTGVTGATTTAAELAELTPTDEERAWLGTALVAERERRREAAIRPQDTGVDVVGRYLKHRADVEPVLASFAAARVHVPSPDGQPVRIAAPAEGKRVDLAAAVGAGVVEFGPGRFDLRGTADGFFDRRKRAQASEIRGAGMDATTLVLGGSQEFMLTEASHSIVFRDLTIEFPDADEMLVDVRGGASVALENVRVSGWASGGHSAAIGVSGLGFIACRGCEFLSTEGQFVLSLRGPGLAVFERCTFADMPSVFIGGGAGSGGRSSVVRVIDSVFLSTRLADSRIRTGAGTEVDLRVRGGTAFFLGPDATDEDRRKKWGAEYAASVDGVTFAAAKPAFPRAALARLLEAVPQDLGAIVSAAPLRTARGAPPRVDLHVSDGERIRRVTVELREGRVEQIQVTSSAAVSPDARAVAGASGLVPLRRILAESEVLATADVRVATYVLEPGSSGERWVARFEGRAYETWRFDAMTGASIPAR